MKFLNRKRYKTEGTDTYLVNTVFSAGWRLSGICQAVERDLLVDSADGKLYISMIIPLVAIHK